MPNHKIYSKVDTLPDAYAKNNLTEGALVLEGGAFRGCYTSGVIDALMLNDINFQMTLGCSAGAMNGYCYLGGKIGKAGRVNLLHRHDSRYVGLRAYNHNRGIIGFDYLFNELQEKEPIDEKRFNDPKRRLLVVATRLEDGEGIFFEKGRCTSIEKAVQASASMPYVSKPVEIDGNHYLDGGCAIKVPYKEALRLGAKKVVVVLTREKGYRKGDGATKKAARAYKKYPDFYQKLMTVNRRTDEEYDEIDKLGEEGKIFVIYPSTPVHIERLERDMEKLGALYWQGYNDTIKLLPALKEYLAK